MRDRIAEVILTVLKRLARRFGLGLVPVEGAEALAHIPIPYEV